MSEYTITYTYDNLNRVICKERSDGATIEYQYDDQSRLVQKTVSKPEPSITVNVNVSPDWKSAEKIMTDALRKEMYWVR